MKVLSTITQSEDPISCYGKPVERTDEIVYRIWVTVATDGIMGLSLIAGDGLTARANQHSLSALSNGRPRELFRDC